LGCLLELLVHLLVLYHLQVFRCGAERVVQRVVRFELLAQTFLLVPHVVVYDSLVAVIVLKRVIQGVPTVR
jgi:hypothetical protein